MKTIKNIYKKTSYKTIKFLQKIMILIWIFKLPDITFAPRLLVNLSAFASFIPVTRMFQAKAESILECMLMPVTFL